MAHIYDIPVEPAYIKGKRATSRTEYPKGDVFRGFNAPSRFEGEVFDLEVFGRFLRLLMGLFAVFSRIIGFLLCMRRRSILMEVLDLTGKRFYRRWEYLGI